MDINTYKLKVKEVLMTSFFSSKNKISGKEILSFCDEKQINMFIIFLLMKEWKLSMENLKNPYFDFNHKDVKEALNSYMNTVSKYISINKSDFEKLLSKALDYTFQLAENPESFIVSNRLENDLQELNKYIEFHKPYFEGDKDYEIESKLENIKSRFDVVLGVPKNNESAQEEIKSDENNIEIEPETPKPLVDVYEEENEPLIVLQKIENIKNAISINQKFIFVNELFNGNNEQYNVTIDRLENCSGLEEANNNVLELDINDSNKEAAEQLSLLIKQKYNF